MNIAEILKEAPEGTKLYSPLCGEVTFSEIDEDLAYCVLVKDRYGSELIFDEIGRYDNTYEDAECLLFPSKDNRDWSTFKYKVISQFPTNYLECCRLLDINEDHQCNYGYYARILDSLQKLLICRNAWWKVDGDWKPNWENNMSKYDISPYCNEVIKGDVTSYNRILAFRTKEIRDKFLETFRDLIEDCKELI